MINVFLHYDSSTKLSLEYDPQDGFDTLQIQICSAVPEIDEKELENVQLLDFMGRLVKSDEDLSDVLYFRDAAITQSALSHSESSLTAQHKTTEVNLWFIPLKLVENNIYCTRVVSTSEIIQPIFRLIDTQYLLCSKCRWNLDSTLVIKQLEPMQPFICQCSVISEMGLIDNSIANEVLMDQNSSNYFLNNNPIQLYFKRLQLRQTLADKSKTNRSTHAASFRSRIQSGLRIVQVYEDILQQRSALQCVDFEKIRKYIDDHIIELQSKNVPMQSDEEILIIALMRWFKCDFFKWCTKPACSNSNCTAPPRSGNIVSMGVSEVNEYEKTDGWASRTEMYSCKVCQTVTRFARFNNPAYLLTKSPMGRCGEFANAFGLLLRAFTFDVRYVLDFTDHVWVEAWIPKLNRFVHIDPCERAIDTPLMYEGGWNKKLTHLLSYSRYGLVDASPRYSRKLNELIPRRDAEICDESVAQEIILEYDQSLCNSYHQYLALHPLIGSGSQMSLLDLVKIGPDAFQARAMSDPSSLSLNETAVSTDDDRLAVMMKRRRRLSRELEGLTFFTSHEWKQEELQGRISGDLKWKLSRGEAGETSPQLTSKDTNTSSTATVSSTIPPWMSSPLLLNPLRVYNEVRSKNDQDFVNYQIQCQRSLEVMLLHCDDAVDGAQVYNPYRSSHLNVNHTLFPTRKAQVTIGNHSQMSLPVGNGLNLLGISCDGGSLSWVNNTLDGSQSSDMKTDVEPSPHISSASDKITHLAIFSLEKIESTGCNTVSHTDSDHSSPSNGLYCVMLLDNLLTNRSLPIDQIESKVKGLLSIGNTSRIKSLSQSITSGSTLKLQESIDLFINHKMPIISSNHPQFINSDQLLPTFTCLNYHLPYQPGIVSTTGKHYTLRSYVGYTCTNICSVLYPQEGDTLEDLLEKASRQCLQDTSLLGFTILNCHESHVISEMISITEQCVANWNQPPGTQNVSTETKVELFDVLIVFFNEYGYPFQPIDKGIVFVKDEIGVESGTDYSAERMEDAIDCRKYYFLGGKIHGDTACFDSSRFLSTVLSSFKSTMIQTPSDVTDDRTMETVQKDMGYEIYQSMGWNDLKLKKIIIWAGENFVNGIQCVYTISENEAHIDGLSATSLKTHQILSPIFSSYHDEPKKYEIEFDEGDQVDAISVRFGNIIDSVMIETRLGRTMHCGGSGGEFCTKIQVPSDAMVCGFFGGTGGHLHNLGVILSYTSQSTKKSIASMASSHPCLQKIFDIRPYQLKNVFLDLCNELDMWSCGLLHGHRIDRLDLHSPSSDVGLLIDLTLRILLYNEDKDKTRNCFRMILIYHENLLKDINNPKYQVVNIFNRKFIESVGMTNGGIELFGFGPGSFQLNSKEKKTMHEMAFKIHCFFALYFGSLLNLNGSTRGLSGCWIETVSMAYKNNQKLGDNVWGKMNKINSELFTLTYGSLVMQLLKDFESVPLVNEQLEKIGHNIGVRLIDEFLAKSGINNCSNFKETADVISKVAFKMFLGITPEITSWSKEANAFSLILTDNPFIDFVELPPQYQDLQYCNILCGIIKGAMEMVQLQVEAQFVRDILRGDDINEIRIELKGIVKNVMSDEYKEN